MDMFDPILAILLYAFLLFPKIRAGVKAGAVGKKRWRQVER